MKTAQQCDIYPHTADILKSTTIADEQFQHKLNYFLFFPIFEKIFIILYKHHLPKISELENQLLKLRFEI